MEADSQKFLLVQRPLSHRFGGQWSGDMDIPEKIHDYNHQVTANTHCDFKKGQAT